MNTYGNLYFTRCCLLKKLQNILQQFYSYFKGIIAIESNLLNSKSFDFTSSSKYERRIHGVVMYYTPAHFLQKSDLVL